MRPHAPSAIERTSAALVFTLLLTAMGGCGGYDDYRFQYESDATLEDAPVGSPWAGPERISVALGDATRDVALDGMPTVIFADVPAILLADLIRAAEVTERPEDFRYDFTASDDYNLLAKRGSVDLLPEWEDLKAGYLYRAVDGDLRVGWDPDRQPWGSAVSAYRVKYMDGGIITLLPRNNMKKGAL